MKYSIRFYISWITAALFMYAAFYVWHGLFLNDLNNITFPKPIFFGLTALVYLAISYVLYRTYESKIINKIFHYPVIRGIASGFIVGFLLFAFVTVLGISFTSTHSLKYMLADSAWQIIEQVIGGLIITIGKLVIFDHLGETIRD